MNRVLVCDTLDERSLAFALSRKCDGLITNNIALPQGFSISNIEIIDANQYRKAGSWRAYNANKKLIDKIKTRHPALFKYRDLDLTKAFYKYLYWTNYKNGYLEEAVVQVNSSTTEFIYYSDVRSKPFVNLAAVLLIFVQSIFRSSKSNTVPKIDKKYRLVLFIGSMFQLNFWNGLIKEFDNKSTVVYYYPDGSNTDLYDYVKQEGFELIEVKKKQYKPASLFNFFNIKLNELFVFKHLLRSRPEFEKFIDQAIEVANQTSETLLVNGFENMYQGNLLYELTRAHNLTMINTSNGIRTGNATCADAEFDAFLIWDQAMKKILHEEVGLPEEKLINLDIHLMQDVIKDHEFQNSLIINKADIENKKVITFGSCRGKRNDKIEALDTIYSLLKKHDDYILLYRPHPAELKEDYYLPHDASIKDRVYLIDYNEANSKTTLYDQFILSDLTVVPTSTVALESKWAGVPAITYEQSETPFLYCVDDKTIFHVRDVKQLADKIEELLNTSPLGEMVSEQFGESAAKIYGDFIKNFKQKNSSLKTSAKNS